MSTRRDEIIEVAKTIFAERGVKQTTVRQIGASAGILSGSLYHHFTSKDAIVDAILGDFCQRSLEGYREIMATEGSSLEKLRAMTRFAFNQVIENEAAIVILLNESPDLVQHERFSYLISYNNEIEQDWLSELARGVKAGEIRSELDAALVYRFARDVILGTTRWYKPEGDRTVAEITDSFINVMLNGIASPH